MLQRALMLVRCRSEVVPAADFSLGAIGPGDRELGPVVEVVKRQRADVDLVLEGVRSAQVLTCQRPADAEHLLGIGPGSSDCGEQILAGAAGGEKHPQERLVLE